MHCFLGDWSNSCIASLLVRYSPVGEFEAAMPPTPGRTRSAAAQCLLRCAALGVRNVFAKEAQKLSVHFVCMRAGDSVWAAFHNVQAGSLDEFGGALSRRREPNNPIVIAADDERRHIHADKILSKVFKPSGNACQTRRAPLRGYPWIRTAVLPEP